MLCSFQTDWFVIFACETLCHSRRRINQEKQRYVSNDHNGQCGTNSQKISHVTTLKRFSSWSYDMKGHAEQCVKRKFEVVKKSVSHRKQEGTITVKKHDFEVVGEVGPVYTQIALKC